MSWRDTLGLPLSTDDTPCAQNSHNSQKPDEPDNCADIAYFAHQDSEEEISKLLEAVAEACRGVNITPAEVKQALAPEDIDDWRKGAISADALTAFVGSLVQRREMDRGMRPSHYTEQANCKHCGPIWLWFSGHVVGCPWCWNRVANRPIPRPCPVRCNDCTHFERADHPRLGHCAKGEPEALGGLWDTDQRYCGLFIPFPK